MNRTLSATAYSRLALAACLLLAGALRATAVEHEQGVHYPGGEGPGKGKHIVLVGGDEEYRSEESLPQLAKILSTEHGFDCTVLLAFDPKTGVVNPNVRDNIPGLEALKTADLMILLTRRRNLPDEQMQHVVDYAMAGKPVVGLRTATHAFQPGASSKFAQYSDTYDDKKNKAWEGGFGRIVLGERWVAHLGHHKHESTSGIVAPGAADHPILHGIKSNDIWVPTDVYSVRLPLPGDSQPLLLGQVIARKGEYDEHDRFYGLRPDDGPPVSGEKNNPMMPVAWAKTYALPGSENHGRAFDTTMGASVDLLNEAMRRLVVNGVYWAVGIEDKIPEGGTRADLVGKYDPTQYGFQKDSYWAKRKMTLDELRADAAAK